MAYKRKSWREKLADDKGGPRIIKITGKWAKRMGEGTCVIPTPREVNELMSRVGKGELTTIDQLRKTLAKKHRATVACPICTGIFAWVSAFAAEEDAKEGKKRITPYWRTLKANNELNPKYPGGLKSVRKLLESEGHTVILKGKRMFVAS